MLNESKIDWTATGAVLSVLPQSEHAPYLAMLTSAKTEASRETTQTKARAKKAEQKAEKVSVEAKPKANRHPYDHKGVKLTAPQWAVWVAVKALLDAKAELVKNTEDEGFAHLSGKFVAQFIGTPSNRKEQGRINQHMTTLKRKGLLVWQPKEVQGSRKNIKIKDGIGFGPKA